MVDLRCLAKSAIDSAIPVMLGVTLEEAKIMLAGCQLMLQRGVRGSGIALAGRRLPPLLRS